jgi:hypothetical protein
MKTITIKIEPAGTELILRLLSMADPLGVFNVKQLYQSIKAQYDEGIQEHEEKSDSGADSADSV